MKAAAFCPGHISCIFQVCRHRDFMRTGTRGAGICIDRGATARVECWRGEGIEIAIDGRLDDAPVTHGLLTMLLPEGYGAKVDIVPDLPPGHGFAMSAAGTLATGIALGSLLEISEDQIGTAAHVSEVMNGGGLGDVAGILCGGVGVRTSPGLPPYGEWQDLGHDPKIAVGIVGPPIPTADVLANEDIMAMVNEVGRRCLDSFIERSDMGALVRTSRQFAEETGLITSEVREALSALDGQNASMVMLGNSVFSIGEMDSDLRTLSGFGEVHRVGVDRSGPHLLR